MKNLKIILYALIITAGNLLFGAGTNLYAENSPNKTGGNPVLPGFHADPEILYSKQTGKFYIYSTTDGFPGWGGYNFYCFSSKDLVNWKNEGVILDLKKDVDWASGNAWAPCIEEKYENGKYTYYFYYSGETGHGKAIGLAIANKPEGPFIDMGKPVVDFRPKGVKRGQQIDVDVFTDPVSGKSYLYWGNAYMAGAELNKDMKSVKMGTITVLTPQGGSRRDYAYREGTYVFYRKGIYYFSWSVDDTGSRNYHIAYGTSHSPLGPISVAKQPVILIQNPEKEIYGTGHHSILKLPGKKDKWYIIYHRINKNFINKEKGPGYHREVCIDRLKFGKKGTIKRTIPTQEGIKIIK